MLLGSSPYCVPLTERKTLSKEDGLLGTLVIHHLEFVANYGTDAGEVWNRRFYEHSRPTEFEEWLSRGAPGFVWDDLDAYLRDKPLDRGESAANRPRPRE
jgi:hypothetical protein